MAMAGEDVDSNELLQQLITGLQVLQADYVQLFEQHAALEIRLATARDEYNDLAKQYGRTIIDTPPASLSSRKEHGQPLSAAEILSIRDQDSAAAQLRAAHTASQLLQAIKGRESRSGQHSRERSMQESKMPSISESPMEQDFTVPGTPSRLGCPFASMSGKKLSSHAASVLSRYHGSQQDGRGSVRDGMSVRGSPSRAGSLIASKSNRRRSALVDPVRAEFCGLESSSKPPSLRPQLELEDAPEPAQESGVCPIRFLDQHSPEEIATYFERHKHELPRSHEVCVRRYQSNQEQVRELDARYGDVAQMIKSLGEKHQSFLPDEPADEIEDGLEEFDQGDDTRVREWANDVDDPVSKQPEGTDSRQPHFDRPMRDVRVGESPSRPWGISIPPQYHERAVSETSSAPVQIKPAGPSNETTGAEPLKISKCPFANLNSERKEDVHAPKVPSVQVDASPAAGATINSQPPAHIFSGPIFVGYKPEEAALFLNKLGYHNYHV